MPAENLETVKSIKWRKNSPHSDNLPANYDAFAEALGTLNSENPSADECAAAVKIFASDETADTLEYLFSCGDLVRRYLNAQPQLINGLTTLMQAILDSVGCCCGAGVTGD